MRNTVGLGSRHSSASSASDRTRPVRAITSRTLNVLSRTAMLMVFGLQTIPQYETVVPSNKNPAMLIDCHNHLGVDLYFYCNGHSPYCQDLPAMVTEGRHCGVDRWIVF